MFTVNLDNKKKNHFAYIVKENLLEKKDIDCIKNNFPNELFNKIEQKYINPEEGRTNIQYNNKDFRNFIKQDEKWNELSLKLCSGEFATSLIKIFREEIKEQIIDNIDIDRAHFSINTNSYWDMGDNNLNLYNRIIQILKIKFNKQFIFLKKFILGLKNAPLIIIDFQVCVGRSGYKLKPHIDGRNKLMSILFYLNKVNDEDNNSISNLELYENDNTKDPLNYIGIIPDQEFNKFQSIEVEPNKLVVLLNGNNAFHGVEAWNSKNKREFIYVTYSVIGEENIWKTNKIVDKKNSE